MVALGESGKPEKGNLRETFFANIVSSFYTLSTVEKGDFLVDGKYTFEVGRKGARIKASARSRPWKMLSWPWMTLIRDSNKESPSGFSGSCISSI